MNTQQQIQILKYRADKKNSEDQNEIYSLWKPK